MDNKYLNVQVKLIQVRYEMVLLASGRRSSFSRIRISQVTLFIKGGGGGLGEVWRPAGPQKNM